MLRLYVEIVLDRHVTKVSSALRLHSYSRLLLPASRWRRWRTSI